MAINPINVNTQGIGTAYGYSAKPKSEDKEVNEEAAAAGAKQESKVSADDVFSYLAQSAAVAQAKTKTVDPSKYVDSESAARIADMMAQFEGAVNANVAAVGKEFPEMSDSAKQTIALAQVNSQI